MGNNAYRVAKIFLNNLLGKKQFLRQNLFFGMLLFFLLDFSQGHAHDENQLIISKRFPPFRKKIDFDCIFCKKLTKFDHLL